MIQAYKCGRISIGNFERGPVHILYESHSNAQVPEDCQKDQAGITSIGVLTTFWIDDAEIGAYLQSTFGLPIFVGTVADSESPSPGVTLHTWSWELPDGTSPSEVTVVDANDASARSSLPDRLFWSPEAGTLGRMDLTPVNTVGQVPLAATGTVQPPFYIARDTDGTFVSDAANWYATREATATFLSYEDMLCKVPA